jgi:hypothetical protein
MSPGNYKLVFTGINIPGGITAYLHDLLPGNFLPISLSGGPSVINFTVTADPLSAGNRFSIILKAPTALPATFIKMNASPHGTAVILKWTTGDETSTEHYEVQRSGDAIAFHSIGNILRGNKNYEWIDQHSLNKLAYYRIKGVGFQGAAIYSNVVMTNCYSVETIALYPNPAKDHLYLQMNNLPAGDYVFSLANSLGQNILLKRINHGGGSATGSICIDRFLPGLYLIRMTGAGVLFYQKAISINP